MSNRGEHNCITVTDYSLLKSNPVPKGKHKGKKFSKAKEISSVRVSTDFGLKKKINFNGKSQSKEKKSKKEHAPRGSYPKLKFQVDSWAVNKSIASFQRGSKSKVVPDSLFEKV